MIKRKKAYVGIDIGKKKCDTCVIDEKGRVLERGQYCNTAARASSYAKDIAARYDVHSAACETTGNMWTRTFGAFEDAKISIKLANTYKMAVIARTGKKTDKVDAQKIAQVLRMNMIPECYVPPSHTRALRAMTRQRIRLVQDRTRVINRIHSMLDAHEIVINASNMYAIKAMAQLEKESVAIPDGSEQIILMQGVRQIRHLTEEIAAIDAHIEEEASQNPDAQLLLSMTGVGTYSALLLASEIGDISRFGTPKHLVSWAGLCPVVYQSGDSLYAGRIKKIDTNKQVNWILCEAANTAIHHDPRMASVYESARRRHADKHALAIIVVAHKMATIMWHMLKTRTPYESRNEGLYQSKLSRMKRRMRRKERQ